MRNNYIYLNDKQFLTKILTRSVSTYFAKITVLNWQENPVQEIQGKVISANFNLDGNSNIRRTGNLTLNIDRQVVSNQLFSINKKIQVEIGYENETTKYPNFPIIWFPLGVYVISSVSITHSIDSLTVALQMKDKMCLLNGQCGGTLPAATVFDNYVTIDQNGKQIISRPCIYQIIQQLVSHFGREQQGKIIISDLDSRVKQVMKWTGSMPLYFVQKGSQYEITIDPDYYLELQDDGWKDILGSPFTRGYDVGYIYTDFTFPGDLIGDAGSSVTDVLDKIIQVLGNYEYFYDINGNFVFQQIKNYLNNTQTKYILDKLGNRMLVPDYIADLRQHGSPLPEDYLLDMTYGKAVFHFKDSSFINNYVNSPQYQQIRNDFVVWGIRTTADGIQMPIRYHLAIDKKPKVGNTYKVFGYEDPLDKLVKYHSPIVYSSVDNFPERGAEGMFYLDSSTQIIYKWDEVEKDTYGYASIDATMIQVETQNWQTELYLQGVTAQPYGTESNYYYTELINQWPKIFEIVYEDQKYQDKMREQIEKSPESVDFFLDIIDSQSKIGQFQVDNIGRRSKILNENKNVNCVFEPQIPDIILLPISTSDIQGTESNKMKAQATRRGQTWFQVNDDIYKLLSIGGSFNSCYQIIRQLLHEYTSYNQNISFTCLPIYFLQPNTRIEVRDNDSYINGNYIINSMSFTIGADGMMTINATRALEKI